MLCVPFPLELEESSNGWRTSRVISETVSFVFMIQDEKFGAGGRDGSLVIPVVPTHPMCWTTPASLLDTPCGNACTGFDVNDPCGSQPWILYFSIIYLLFFLYFMAFVSITQHELSKVE